MTPNTRGVTISNLSGESGTMKMSIGPATDTPADSVYGDAEELGQDQECLVARVDRVYDIAARNYDIVKSILQSPKRLSPKYGIAVVRQFDEKNALLRSWIEIRRDGLRDLLAKILKDAHGVAFGESPAIIEAQHLYYAENELRKTLADEEKSLTKNSPLIGQIKAALKVLDEEFIERKSGIQTLLQEQRITFDTLWAIFPPNCHVYSLDRFSEPVVYQLRRHIVISDAGNARAFRIEGRHIEHDGNRFGWTTPVILDIPYFDGAKPISSLPVFPLDFHPDEGIRETLETRGQWRLHFPDVGTYHYNGTALREWKSPSGKDGLVEFHCSGRVIFDARTLHQTEPMNVLVKQISEFISEDELEEDDFIFFPNVAYGYSLEDKCWGAFLISMIGHVEWDATVWDSSILPDGRKDQLLEIFQSQASQLKHSEEAGCTEGSGLVVLFTGPTGSGKTMTAKAIAEKLNKSLYAMSVSELGHAPGEFREKLHHAMDLARRWDAILLLTDTEALVGNYDGGDILRNFIVSSFIRLLDSYRGLVILTAAGSQGIHPAFKGRIHITHAFSSLDQRTRSFLWKKYLGHGGDEHMPKQLLGDDVLNEFAIMELNGHQIQSTVTLARAIAKTRKSDQIVDILRDVISISFGSPPMDYLLS